MAIVTPSALVESITGRIGGSVLEVCRGVNYIRAGPHPSQPRVTLQQHIRGLINDYAGLWDGLSAGRKTAWNYYATGLPGSETGVNAYVAANAKLAYANYTTLTPILDPPAWPGTPTAPGGSALTYNAGADEWRAAWTSPTGYALYVQCFMTIQVAYNEGDHPAWTFVETSAAANSPIAFSAAAYESGTIARARLRVINADGEVSAWAAIQEATKS
jgi:hypothetical protein